MGKPAAFLECPRQEVPHRPVAKRVKDFLEVDLPLPTDVLIAQAARCMDCGIPFCHGGGLQTLNIAVAGLAGCPLGNRMPEFNDMICRGKWREASDSLHATNNFPEITGRVCPAPCEAACTLNISDQPVLIRHIECQIVERGFAEGWIRPLPAPRRTGKRVAVIGSGPAGLAAAQQLARAGHDVVVFEQDDRIGGLLRYGIPDFKLDKRIIDRRLEQLLAEGVQFQTGVVVGQDISARYLRKTFDAVCLTMGAGEPRNLPVPGRGLENVRFAMDYLRQQNRLLAGDSIDPHELITARDRVVVIIGGGDTGSDCVGTAIRQGAREVHLLEILPQPPQDRNPETPWPTYPRILRTSTSHEEGCRRRWSVTTRRLTGTDVRMSALHGAEVEWIDGPKGPVPRERPGSEFSMKADLVLLAMGFLHVEHAGLITDLGMELDSRGNVVVKGGLQAMIHGGSDTSDCMTSVDGVFAAGDTVCGASLVVRAIASGREAAGAIDRWLRKE